MYPLKPIIKVLKWLLNKILVRMPFRMCLEKKNKFKWGTYLFNEIQDILIINEFNVTPVNFLSCVFLLFHLEDVLVGRREKKKKCYILETQKRLLKDYYLSYLVKMLLELFICKIDTELLKTALSKIFISKRKGVL